MDFSILRFDSIDSTNLEALRQASSGAAEGLVVIADEQTSGRGRAGRKWVSHKGFGLYISIVLRPQLSPRFLSLITLMSALAVYDTLVEEFGLSADIKWPNDVIVREKKISGILAETTETGTGLAVVVGIGLNLRSANFPAELSESATSLESELQLNDLSRAEPSLLGFFDYWYQVLGRENGPKKIIEAWRDRSTYFSGKRVIARLENESITGTTDGLESNGALRIRKDDGNVVLVHSGDVMQFREHILNSN